MSDTTLDPLSADVGQEVKYPLIKPDTRMNFFIKEAKKVTNEKSNNEQVVCSCTTESDCIDTDGETLYKGFTVTHRLNAKVTEKVTAKSISESFRTLCQAVGLKGMTVAQVIADPSVLNGKIFSATVKISKDKTGQYPDSNSLRPQPLAE